MVTLTGSPFKGNQLKAETGKKVHFRLLVVVHAAALSAQSSDETVAEIVYFERWRGGVDTRNDLSGPRRALSRDGFVYHERAERWAHFMIWWVLADVPARELRQSSIITPPPPPRGGGVDTTFS